MIKNRWSSHIDPMFHLLVSLVAFCWWRHNRLLMTSQWPDNCDTSTWQVICYSLDVNFIHGDIHSRSCKRYIDVAAHWIGTYKQGSQGAVCKWQKYLLKFIKYAINESRVRLNIKMLSYLFWVIMTKMRSCLYHGNHHTLKDSLCIETEPR